MESFGWETEFRLTAHNFEWNCNLAIAATQSSITTGIHLLGQSVQDYIESWLKNHIWVIILKKRSMYENQIAY